MQNPSNKKQRILLGALCFSLALPYGTWAQPENPGTPVPIDGGLTLLLAAGAAYGAKKWQHNRRRNTEENKEN